MKKLSPIILVSISSFFWFGMWLYSEYKPPRREIVQIPATHIDTIYFDRYTNSAIPLHDKVRLKAKIDDCITYHTQGVITAEVEGEILKEIVDLK